MAVAEEAIAIGRRAKEAAGALANLSTELKNQTLMAMADLIEARQDFLLAENAKDTAYAGEKGLSEAVIDRLTLNPQRVAAMAAGLRDIVALPRSGSAGHPQVGSAPTASRWARCGFRWGSSPSSTRPGPT